jgi:hypothetical protein
MKKTNYNLVFRLIGTGLWAQNVGGAKVVTVSQVIQKMALPCKWGFLSWE